MRALRHIGFLTSLLMAASACAPAPRPSDLETDAAANSVPPAAASSAARPAINVTAKESSLVASLLEFARSGDPISAAPISFAADGVLLGLGDDVLVARTPEELAEPSAWVLDVDTFREHVGPFSALDQLGDVNDVTVTAGPHPHCAAPPALMPPETVGLRQISIQPANVQSCLQWWTVDLFLDGREVKVVTMDLWDP